MATQTARAIPWHVIRGVEVLLPSDWSPRSLLFIPANRASRYLTKAIESSADAVVLDLEDAVPGPEKNGAREGLAFLGLDSLPIPALVRVNPGSDADVRAAVAAGAGAIVVPKVEDPGQVAFVCRQVDRLRSSVRVVPLIESAKGVLAAASIASVDARVLAIALGGEDLAADLGVTRTIAGVELHHARGIVVLAAAAAGVWAIDTPCTDVSDPEATRAEALLARSIGFAAKFAIHPLQVAAINDVFGPAPEELSEAERIVNAFVARGDAIGPFVLDGRMIDPAVATAARRLLTRAGARRTTETRLPS